jgi:hypothetical protein
MAIQVGKVKKKVARRKGLELVERLRRVAVAKPFGWVRASAYGHPQDPTRRGAFS